MGYKFDKKNLSRNLAMMILFLLTILTIGHVRENNGRIEMCNELGLVYTLDKECVTCEESGRKMVDGECVIPKSDFETFNNGEIYINNKDG